MPRFLLPLLAAVAIACTAPIAADPAPKGPADPPKPLSPVEVKGKPGRAVVLTAPAEWKGIRWLKCDLDSDLVADSAKPSAVFVCDRVGTFTVFAVPEQGEPLTFSVTLGKPDPPIPPQPDPPSDPLTRDLQALFSADSSTTKAGDLAKLTALWKKAATYARDRQFVTSGQLIEAMRLAAKAEINASLMTLRTRIGAELSANLPTDPDSPLDDTSRGKLEQLAARVAKCLEAVK